MKRVDRKSSELDKNRPPPPDADKKDDRFSKNLFVPKPTSIPFKKPSGEKQ